MTKSRNSKWEVMHKNALADLGCMLCHEIYGKWVAPQIHHIRTGQGMSQRAEDFLAIPLCPDCHQGPQGIHGDRSLLKVVKMTELDLLAKTIEELWKHHW